MTTLRSFTSLGLTLIVCAGALAPAHAVPLFASRPMQSEAAQHSDVVQVRDGYWRRGYRGYRSYRPGYRYNDGWWFPGGAFVAGALIGGAIANSYDYGPYYGRGYYGNYYEPRYYQPRYYARRVYQAPPGAAYRQGYRDGYRAGRAQLYDGGYPCSPRLADAGQC